MNNKLVEGDMKDTKYNSRTEKPIVRSTSNGGRYVRPSDIVRSTSGRAIIKSHASATASFSPKKSEPSDDSTPKK